MFRPVPKEFDLPALEEEVIEFWTDNEVEKRYLNRNRGARERFSFLDGPMTANGPMGVHHAWGRTYKDLWQRYNTMLGKEQRYQNGFDCQGLWVEVTVERQLGFASKRDIEAYGMAEFIRACKADVFKWAAVQTAQSRRLGYFMDWDNSYYTLSDENNYTIWHFLKECSRRGLLYKGHDVMPWCTRCGTGISDAEAAEGYQDMTHTSVYVRFPVANRPGEYLLVWTTTPWTLTSNVAVAVNPELTYVRAGQGEAVYYLAEGALPQMGGGFEVLERLPGSSLVGLQYVGPYDDLSAAENVVHTIVPWAEVSQDEGTGLVHIAPGCGKEDFALGREFGLAVIAPLDESGFYGDGFGWLSGRNVNDIAPDIAADLDKRGLLFRAHSYSHRYPTCWRCGTPLVFRLVDEWFISMDSLRAPMMEVVRQIRWIPSYGLERELDWLRNMGDWMISKKRFWGLALPFWECPDGHVEVIGGKEELFDRAIGGIEHLESPHRPWVDEVTISCAQCGQVAHRIPDVGNPWLDAGIVPYSTLHYATDSAYWEKWFPADFITESFPGQFRNWFYSMLAMSTVLEDAPPFLNILGYQTLRDEFGREMHKSWGNTIPFDEAAARAGADAMRWLFVNHSIETNINFGFGALDEVKRRLLTLWNTYRFFVTYAELDGWRPAAGTVPVSARSLLDRWMLARVNETVVLVRAALDDFNAPTAAAAIEDLTEDLSTWYVRRSRARFWKSESDSDKYAAYSTLYEALTTVTGLIAPFMPFLGEHLYQNLVRTVSPDAALSVHLTDYPVAEEELVDRHLLHAMSAAQKVVALGRAARERANIKVRQPLSRLLVKTPSEVAGTDLLDLRGIILDELNVKELDIATTEAEFVSYTVRPNLPALGPRYGKLVPHIRRVLEEQDAAQVVRAVERGEDVQLTVDGRVVTLAPEEILTSAQPRENFQAVAEEGYVVVLDTRLTPDLVDEGWAREVVRRVNDWRREAGFNIEDRIDVTYSASGPLAAAIARHLDYIQRETLATSFTLGDLDAAGFGGEASFGDQWLQVLLARSPVTVIP